MSKKIVFSPASIDALTTGSIADLQTPGLAIVPISVPKKRWIFRRRVARSKTIVQGGDKTSHWNAGGLLSVAA